MIRAGVVGYGNLGRGIAENLQKTPDFQLVRIFTRRNPSEMGENFDSLDNILEYRDKIDVLFLAVGSATDIPEIAPMAAKHFNTVDAYDNHQELPRYLEDMNRIGIENQKTSIIATGWDPGLFSLNRLMVKGLFNDSKLFTFWGKGVSQGHSDAVRRITGVKYAVQYTIPKEDIIQDLKKADKNLLSHESHDRVCYVVSESQGENKRIEEEIKSMVGYFDKYKTQVNFISEEEYFKDHTAQPHGGHVIGIGESANNTVQSYKFSLELESNPEFTALVNIMCGRALYKLVQDGKKGSFTIFDIPPIYYVQGSREDYVRELL